MTSTVTRIQKGWHPNASSYVQDTDPLSAKERAEWDANVDQTLGRYGADVPDDAVPDADAVHFFSVSQGSRNRWKTIAGVYIGSTLRLWSARVYPTQAQKKAASRLSALQLLACNIDQHFQRYNDDQRSSAVMSRLKTLRIIKGLGIEQAALALTDADAANCASSTDPSFIQAMDLRNQNYKSLGIRIGSMVQCVTDGLSAGEVDADVLAGLERLRHIMEGSAAALVKTGIIRVPKDRSRLNKRQRTLLFGYECIVKVQAALVTAATLKEAADAGSKALKRWGGDHLRTVGMACEMVQAYRENQGQRRDPVLERAMDAIKRRGFYDSESEESESGDSDAAGPSTKAPRRRRRQRRSASPSSTTSKGRAVYTVPLAPPGPSSSASTGPRHQIYMPDPASPKAALAAARASAAAMGLSPSASPSPRRSSSPRPNHTPSPAASPRHSPSPGPAAVQPAAAPPSPVGRGQAIVSWLRRSLSRTTPSPSATPAATPAATPRHSPSSPQKKKRKSLQVWSVSSSPSRSPTSSPAPSPRRRKTPTPQPSPAPSPQKAPAARAGPSTSHSRRPSSRGPSPRGSPSAAAKVGSSSRPHPAPIGRALGVAQLVQPPPQLAPSTSSPNPLFPDLVLWDFKELPKTAAKLKAFLDCTHQRDNVDFESCVCRADEAFLPRHHRAKSLDWRDGQRSDESTQTAMRDAGAVVGDPKSNAYGDAVLLALAHISEVVEAFGRRADWEQPYVGADPKRQLPTLLLAAFLRLFSEQVFKCLCAADLIEAVRHLPDETGKELTETHGPWAGDATQFHQRIWKYIVRLLLPRLFKDSVCNVRQRRRCTSCGHQQRAESQATCLNMGTVMDKYRAGFFDLRRFEVRAKQDVTFEEICGTWRSERKLGTLICSNPNCKKVGTVVATSEVFGDLPKILAIKLFMSEDKPLTMRLPAGRVDLSRLLRDGAPPCNYLPSAYVIHEGANPKTGHYSVFGRRALDDAWFFHDPRTSGPAQELTAARRENVKAPTRGRPVLLFLEKEGDGSGLDPEEAAFIVTEASRVDCASPALFPRPPPGSTGPGGIPIVARRFRNKKV